ncbi:SDR family oxidoreductase [Hydrogenophaga sp.]|uniref:SDR family NAD(P)-dependent oxidoreductase n=1 Tax=Hydrogenophaga sp. TaxID=1904254 RepID=UPI00260C7A48|nr:SDR family oxidoreductase [Hydrogenophaga sp.]MCW5654369.1 SDR family oxidoreductase [Hydrogenophaga sp.]
MDLKLTGQHVLITGGSRGIGLACALGFLREGARVSIVGRDTTHLQTARETLHKETGQTVATHAADLSDAQAASAMVDSVEQAGGPVDVLVNSAGAARLTPFAELSPAAWQAAMQAKFFSYIHVTDPLIKRMAERGRGAVVNVVGMGGKVATVHHLAGGSANAALMLATAGLAAAYGPKGVRVNAVNPALTLTDRAAAGIAADARQRQIPEAEALRQAESRAPLGRLARPEDIADVVVFLASPRAGYVSGVSISMDGAAVPMVV